MRGNAQSVFLQLGGDRLAVVKVPPELGGVLMVEGTGGLLERSDALNMILSMSHGSNDGHYSDLNCCRKSRKDSDVC